MYLTTTPRVDDTYMAKAVTGDRKINYENDSIYGEFEHHVSIIGALCAYLLCPNILILSFLLIMVFILLLLYCKSCNNIRETLLRKLLEILKENITRQANTVTVIAMCILATIHNCALDVASFFQGGPSYYHKISCIEVYTAFSVITSLLCLVVALFMFLISLVIWIRQKQFCQNNTDATEQRDGDKFHLGLLISAVLCTGSAVLSFSIHIPFIFIAWTTNPFYASKIAIYYGIVIFVYFVIFKNAYTLPFVCLKGLQCSTKYWTFCGIFSIFVAGVVTVLIHIICVLFFVVIPINNSITESVSGIQSLYHSAILLVGGVITYNIVWFYFSKPFSVEKALKKTLKEMEQPPCIVNDEWKDLSEVERMKQIIEAWVKTIEKQGAADPEPQQGRDGRNTPRPPQASSSTDGGVESEETRPSNSNDMDLNATVATSLSSQIQVRVGRNTQRSPQTSSSTDSEVELKQMRSSNSNDMDSNATDTTQLISSDTEGTDM